MNTKIKHWIVVLERIKTELLWKPYENDAAQKIRELINEMKEAVEETKRE
jgi:hypothetical protein